MSIDFDLAPKLKCSVFNACTLSINKFEFKNFIFNTQFLNWDIKSEALDLPILMNYLTGYAFQIVVYLTILDEKLPAAFHILTEEFLDMDGIVKISVLIYSSKPSSDDHTSVKHFLMKVKANFLELEFFQIRLFRRNS